MFDFSCSINQLRNILIHCLSERLGTLFPIDRGWKLIIPQNTPYSIIASSLLFYGEEQYLLFYPIDHGSNFEKIKKKVYQYQKYLSALPDVDKISRQLICITDEKKEPLLKQYLEQQHINTPLLYCSYDRLRFSQGEFDEQRLNFRLERFTYDADTISSFLYVPYAGNHSDGEEKYLVMRRLFGVLNRICIRGEKDIRFQEILESVVFGWELLEKKEKKDLYLFVFSNFKKILEQYQNLPYRLQGKDPKDMGNMRIENTLVDSPKINLSLIIKSQQKALVFLRNEREKLKIFENPPRLIGLAKNNI